MKGSLPKIAEVDDIDAEKQMFKDVVHEVVHHALINQPCVLIKTIKIS